MGLLGLSTSSLTQKGKNGLKIVDCIFIRYTINSKEYQFLVHKLKNLDTYK